MGVSRQEWLALLSLQDHLLPARIAKYVVVHEMAHCTNLLTLEFWRRVERALPDSELRKDWLSRIGGSVEGLSVAR
jgi:predicted metal-dependent hydrolase